MDYGCTGCNVIHHWAPLFIVQFTSMNMWRSVRLHLFQILSLIHSKQAKQWALFIVVVQFSVHIFFGAECGKLANHIIQIGEKDRNVHRLVCAEKWRCVNREREIHVTHRRPKISISGSRLLRPIDFSFFFVHDGFVLSPLFIIMVRNLFSGEPLLSANWQRKI